MFYITVMIFQSLNIKQVIYIYFIFFILLTFYSYS